MTIKNIKNKRKQEKRKNLFIFLAVTFLYILACIVSY